MRGSARYALISMLLIAGCRLGASGPVAPSELSVVSEPAVVAFFQRAETFYRHLEGRRFNSVTTFRDRFFRDYFQDEIAFSNYYADLANELVELHVKRNRPLFARVEEFLVDGPGSARVRVRIGGDNGLPLRFWRVSTLREDRWERHQGQWWIIPGAG